MHGCRVLVAMVLVGCGSKAPPPPPIKQEPAPEPVKESGLVLQEPTLTKAEPPVDDAKEPPPPKLDVAAELAWAKQRFPKQLGRFEIGSHLDDLRAWVAPKATIPVFASTKAWKCKRGTLSRDDQGELSLVVYTEEKRGTRKFITGSIGEDLYLGGSGGDETLRKDGTWEQNGMWGKSDQGSWGHLSSVSNSTARYTAKWVDLEASCKGAVTKVQCTNGGSIDCNACTDVTLTVKDRPMGMMGRSVAGVPIQLGCSCPTTTNPDLDRITALIPELDGWTTDPKVMVPSLYRDKEACSKGR